MSAPRLGNEGFSSPAPNDTAAGPAPVAVPPPDDADVRWAVHRAMWSVSPLRKVRTCRRFRFDAQAEELPLRGLETDDRGSLDVGVGGLQTCATWHSCVCCGAKIAVGRARDLAHAFSVWEALGGTVVLATFSARHHLGHSLRTLVQAQRTAWKHVTSDRPWRRLKERLGVRFVLRAFECTVGDEAGWHPHMHVFLLCDPREWTTKKVPWGTEGRTRTVLDQPIGDPVGITTPYAETVLAECWERWCEGLAEHGLDAISYVLRGGQQESAGFDVKVLDIGPDTSSTELARYPFKMALEAVGSVFKHGRQEPGRRHRTPFEVMESCAVAIAEGDYQAAEADARLIGEWSKTATEMRFRQCQWPPLMRGWFAEKARELGIAGPLLEDEATEQELADAEELGTETVAYISVADYGSVVAYELDTLKAAGRAGGMPAIVAWFDHRGLALDLTDHGTRLHHKRAGADPPPPSVPYPQAA
ncbi:hypothetical protein PH190_17150 [Actinomycetospora straminea]|uniref:Replication protein n=1 Tax=Actinomycetospora straminea TaxID=663607 RepID=A0ABP9DZX6_9PSEU|nr:hypothetical protein [Actinomycetospora straminea]